MNKSKLILFIFLITISCNEEKTKINTKIAIDDLISEYNIPSIENIIVIPGAGCDGCITTAEGFIINNFNQFKNTIIIFTNISSPKILRARLGESIINDPKVILDIDNILEKNGSSSIYPFIIHLEGGEITEIIYQDPDNSMALSAILKP